MSCVFEHEQCTSFLGKIWQIWRAGCFAKKMMPFYETMIVIPKAEFTKSANKPEIVACMRLTVDILGEKRTIMNYIMTPIQKSLSEAFRER